MSFSETIHAITGRLGQEPVGPVPYVAVVPDDYLQPSFDVGILGARVAAGGAGFRSEIEIVANESSLKSGYELTDMWAGLSTNSNVEIVLATAGTVGFAAASPSPVPYTDNPRGLLRRSAINVNTKNSAAATAGTEILALSPMPAGSRWTPIPGRIILRGGPDSFTPPKFGHILVRPTTDNIDIYFQCRFRRLEQRSL